MKATTKPGSPRYRMTISLNVLDHLGLNLYSNVPSVLSEAVANSWDADATLVEIILDKDDQTIVIRDNGCGMDLNDVNEKFLMVGYQRRSGEEVETTKYKRHVMGRKGIGKLSLFSIADTVEVQSAKKVGSTKDKNAFVLRTNDIKKATLEKNDYYPTPIEPTIQEGTTVSISDLRKQITAQTATALRKRLARRFSIIGKAHKFDVKINDKPIGVEDRDYFQKIEYLWTIGEDTKQYKDQCTNVKETNAISGAIDSSLGFEAKGWVGTFDEQKSIEEGNNTVAVLA